MSNEQKAVIIASRDGWVLHEVESVDDSPLYNSGKNELQKPSWLLSAYLTDLNYLVPVAVKVFKEMGGMIDSKDNLDAFNAYCNLWDAYSDLAKTPSGTYQPLFDAVHNAIVYLQNVD